jgi:simple sugar transport system ATP-binding protein
VRRETERLLEEYDVRPRAAEALAGGLSGGNQQKLIFARELSLNPKLIVAAQPTRGVDVGAIEQIHSRLLHARNAGAGVLLVSSELDEILALSDRILVLYRGKKVAEFTRETANERALGLAMGGGQS